jgi:hypothetical protein
MRAGEDFSVLGALAAQAARNVGTARSVGGGVGCGWSVGADRKLLLIANGRHIDPKEYVKITSEWVMRFLQTPLDRCDVR